MWSDRNESDLSQSSDWSTPCNWSDYGSGLINGSNRSGLVEENPSYYSHDYRVVGTFFQGLILLIGVLGNLLVVLVVFRTRSMHSPTNCYLVSLAVADCVVLVASVPNEILYAWIVCVTSYTRSWSICSLQILLRYWPPMDLGTGRMCNLHFPSELG